MLVKIEIEIIELRPGQRPIIGCVYQASSLCEQMYKKRSKC
jgi:hypothetical protein